MTPLGIGRFYVFEFSTQFPPAYRAVARLDEFREGTDMDKVLFATLAAERHISHHIVLNRETVLHKTEQGLIVEIQPDEIPCWLHLRWKYPALDEFLKGVPTRI